jgi:hypothetical protein
VNLNLDDSVPVLRIRYPGSGAFLTPGSGIWDGKKVRIRIRDEQPGSYFLELRNHIFGKILKFFDEDPRSGMEKTRIHDAGWKKVGSKYSYRMRCRLVWYVVSELATLQQSCLQSQHPLPQWYWYHEAVF